MLVVIDNVVEMVVIVVVGFVYVYGVVCEVDIVIIVKDWRVC